MSDENEFEQKSKYIWESKYIRIYRPKLGESNACFLSIKIKFSSFEKAHKAGLRLGQFISGLRGEGR